ncbi:hypothetical protein ACNKHL_03255 [Shigella flexneri]
MIMTATRVKNANSGLINTVIRPIETTPTANQLSAFGNGNQRIFNSAWSTGLSRPRISTVNIRGQGKTPVIAGWHTAKNVKENNAKQGDVDQAEEELLIFSRLARPMHGNPAIVLPL